MGNINKTADKLPVHNQYVLAHFPNRPWGDEDDESGGRFWVVVKFMRGISAVDRERMIAGELEDSVHITQTCPTPPGIWISHETKRSSLYYSEDEHDNNSVPYCWDAFGPGSFFGQEAAVWCELPEASDG